MLNAIVPTNTDRCRREVYTKRMHSPVSSFHLPFDMILVLLSLHEACSLRLCADFTLTHMAENNIYTILKWTHVRWTYDSICWKKWKEKYCRITFAIEIQLCFFFHFFHWNFSNRAVRSKFTVKLTCYRCKKNDTLQFVYRIRLNGFYIWRKKNMPKIVSECEECVLKVARTGIKSIFHVKLKIMETWWTRDFIYQQSFNFPEKMQGDENVKRFLFVLFLILWAARAIITVTQ